MLTRLCRSTNSTRAVTTGRTIVSTVARARKCNVRGRVPISTLHTRLQKTVNHDMLDISNFSLASHESRSGSSEKEFTRVDQGRGVNSITGKGIGMTNQIVTLRFFL